MASGLYHECHMIVPKMSGACLRRRVVAKPPSFWRAETAFGRVANFHS
jgi:hypothetical protein